MKEETENNPLIIKENEHVENGANLLNNNNEGNLLNNDKQKKKKAKIFSEAYPKNKLGEIVKLASYANIHKVIADNNITITKENLIYHPLRIEDYEELVYLHKEWFPINYSKDFFETILQVEELPNMEIFKECDKNKPKTTSKNKKEKISKQKIEIANLGVYLLFRDKEYLIGCISCEITDYKYFEHSMLTDIEFSSDFKSFSFILTDNFLSPPCFAYIMTIGVINEARRLGISSDLIINMKKYLTSKYENCLGYYLHVVDYNNTAINFYKKIGFTIHRKVHNYYNINDYTYDGELLYCLFPSKEARKNYVDNRPNYKSLLVTKFKSFACSVLLFPVKVLAYIGTLCGCYICRKYFGARNKIKLI
jgi:ribosomal protein S18 acetylase RimI-like enzyme